MTNYDEDGIDYEKQITEKDINIPGHRQRCKYAKYKRCLHKTMFICIKQHLRLSSLQS